MGKTLMREPKLKCSKQELIKHLLLYGVTDRAWLKGRTLSSCVRDALQGGTTCIQLREKGLAHDASLALARELKQECDAVGVPFLVNDAIEVAYEAQASGAHVGQDDVSCTQARRALGPNAIIGVSVQTLDEALRAEQEGADYLGVGALFLTPTKPDAKVVSWDELRSICAVVEIPVIGIGGLNAATIPNFAGVGLVGAAVVSALFDADDIATRAQQLHRICEETFTKEQV